MVLILSKNRMEIKFDIFVALNKTDLSVEKISISWIYRLPTPFFLFYVQY